jgi:hypothetical protein
MHRTSKLCRHGLCLLVVALSAVPAVAEKPNKPVPRREVLARTVYEHQFTGYGLTPRDAEQNAVEQARDWLVESAHLGWAPPVGYLLDKKRIEVTFSEPTDEVLRLAGPMKVVQMQLKVSAAQADDILKDARRHVMQERHGLLARVLAGVLAAVLVCAGYLRLEEATRGYYTWLLRAAALLVLAVVGGGLWLTTL